MATCNVCHNTYSTIQYPLCPYCNGMIPANVQNQNTPTTKSPSLPIQQSTINIPTQQIQVVGHEPKTYVICPNCGLKNARFRRHCTSCTSPLPLFSQKQEIQTYDNEIVKSLDFETRKYFKIAGFRVNLIKYLGMSMEKQPCPNCGTICTIIDDDCPNCGQERQRYQCTNKNANGAPCGTKLKTTDMYCPTCKNITLLNFIQQVASGKVRGESGNKILQTWEQVYGFTLFKETYGASMEHSKISDYKNILESVCGEVAKINETFAKGLKSFMVSGGRTADLGDSISAIKNYQMPTISRPVPTNNIADLSQRRAAFLNGQAQPNTHQGGPGPTPQNSQQGQGQTTMSPPPVPTMNTQQQNNDDDEDDEDNAWDDPYEDHDIDAN